MGNPDRLGDHDKDLQDEFYDVVADMELEDFAKPLHPQKPDTEPTMRTGPTVETGASGGVVDDSQRVLDHAEDFDVGTPQNPGPTYPFGEDTPQ